MKTLAIISLFCFIALFFTSQANAQRPTTKTFTEQTDPEAKKIMARIRDKHKALGSLKVDYTLTIENGDTKDVQQGVIYQKGTKFRVVNNKNEMVCDGKTVWMYMKKQNEVQVTDFDPADQDLLSPSKIMDFEEAEKQFIYAITGEDAQAVYIEFKPISKNSEYSKMRIKVLKGKDEVSEVKVFTKDSSRYTLEIKKMETTAIQDSQFNFNKGQYPGVRETDLRD
jgi:outer membrane lipoprotein carrier protein